MQKIAVVTGGNRGIGFEICRQLAHAGIKVVLAARNEENGKEAVLKLQNEGLDVVFYPLDVTREQSVKRLAEWLEQTFGRVDILVNNAGIILDSDHTTLEADIDKIRETFETNVYGPLRVCKALVSLMRKNDFGRIVNMSSGMGAFGTMGTGQPGYRISKTALNAVTKLLSNELAGTNITVNAMAPGSTRTDMNPRGRRPVEDAGATAVWLVTEFTASGKFISDRQEIDW